MSDLLTVKEAAERYKVSKSTLRRWAQRGEVPCRRGPRQTILFRRRDLETEVPARPSALEPTGEIGVYFVRCGDYIKIGFSTDARRRIAGMRTDNPLDVEMIGFIPCTTKDLAIALEAEVHAGFMGYQHRGEWFHAVPELISFIDSEARLRA